MKIGKWELRLEEQELGDWRLEDLRLGIGNGDIWKWKVELGSRTVNWNWKLELEIRIADRKWHVKPGNL